MIKEKIVKVVTEDAVMGGERGCNRSVHSYGHGYDDFRFPLTVSFCEHGEYRVKIKGKEAIIEKITD